MEQRRTSLVHSLRYGFLVLALVSLSVLWVVHKEQHNNPYHQLEQLAETFSVLPQKLADNIGMIGEPGEQQQQQQQQQEQAKEIPRQEQAILPPDTTQDDEPLNIVLLYADDWTQQVLGIYNEHVHTPNLDALLLEDPHTLLMDQNFVTTSICWMSRATLYTGQTVAVHEQKLLYQQNVFKNWNQTLFPLLKQHGYYTGLVGKWHGPTPKEYFNKEYFDVHKLYYGHHWMHRHGKLRHITDLNGEDAIEFLEKRPKDQKFALQVSFFATHAVDGEWKNPYQPMNESMALYQNTTIPLPLTNSPMHSMELPKFLQDPRNEGRFRNKFRFETEYYPQSIKNLYRLATEVDAVVGAIVQKLKEQNIFDKTLIMFTTDNGNLHGQHGLAEKWYAFEESIRVPLVVRDPRTVPSNTALAQRRRNEITLNVDLAPTILSAAKIPVPSAMQGRDMAESYLQPNVPADWRQDFFYEFNTGDAHTGEGHMFARFHIPPVQALVNRQWKYVFWPLHEYEQLFHIEKDPAEEFDLEHLELYNRTVTVQSNKDTFEQMKKRFEEAREISHSGKKI